MEHRQDRLSIESGLLMRKVALQHTKIVHKVA